MKSFDSIRVKRPSEYKTTLDKLKDDKIFQTLADALVFSASVGFSKGLKISFKESDDPIRLSVFDKDQNMAFIYALALADTKQIEMMREDSIEKVISIFEEYACGGLQYIHSMYDSDNSIQCIERLVAENQTSKNVVDIFEENW